MKHFPVQEDRRGRLGQLGAEWGITGRAPLLSLSRPDQPRSYRTNNDEQYAEELLKRQRMVEPQNEKSKGGLSRAFTTKKRSWEHKEVYSALVNHIANQGSPGVAEALISKLNLAGGGFITPQKSRSNLLSRRKSVDLAERRQVLQAAVRNGQVEMVEVLLPYADSLSLDTALPIAIRNQNARILELLIRYGASAAQTADGQEAFREACAAGGRPDLVALVLSSDGRPPASWVSQSMVQAARSGCLRTVAHLSQSTADGNHDNAAALKAAIGMGRKDLVLAILLGYKPPMQPGINEAFAQLMNHQNINPNEKISMAEILLCAGAEGDTIARALVQASATYFLDMVHLLVSYGASIEYEDAIAIRRAVSEGKVDLVKVLLNGKSTLSPSHASECVRLLPKRLRFEERHSLLDLLLRKGASGPPLDEALVDAAEAGDAEAVRLLLSPFFPGAKTTGDQNLRRVSQTTVFERHEIASTDYKGGLALHVAVREVNASVAGIILACKPPSPQVLAQVFSGTRDLPPGDRYQITELFLKAGLSGAPLHSALENAVKEQPPNRDEKLIHLFLSYNADVNFNGGHSISTAIAHNDCELLEKLLNRKLTFDVAAKAIPRAMDVSDETVRLRMITLLLQAGAAQAGSEVSAAVITTIQSAPTDKQLLAILLQQGNADVNFAGGSAVAHAVQHPDPIILNMVIGMGQPSNESLKTGLRATGQLPSSPMKTNKLDVILRRTKPKEIITGLVIEEVKMLVKTRPSDRDFTSLKLLLENRADINANNAEALGRAVAAANMQLVDILFSAKPSPNSLALAMPQALRIRDPKDRLIFAQKIVDAGIPASESNRALVFAVQTHTDDIPLLDTLLSHADTKDGQVLTEAITKERQDIVELILQKKRFPVDALNDGFSRAVKWTNRTQRSLCCSRLLEAGAAGDVVSNALLTAAADGDLEFGKMLVQNGANAEHKGGQAVVEACRSGAADVLKMLLAGDKKVGQQTLQRGFQAATEVGDLEKRAKIFKLLLQMGVAGEVVDAQLVSAVRFGGSGEDLLKLLLEYGASPDYNAGEAVDKATRSAFLGSLEMLLGIVDVGGCQRKPSHSTLARAIDACWDLIRDTRFTVMEWVFEAGKPVPDALHSALNRVMKEEEPEERLIRLLVANGASLVENGCQTLIDATRTLQPSAFARLLESNVTATDASVIFEGAFGAQDIGTLLSERGHEIAKCLLEKGASGNGLNQALITVLNPKRVSTGDIANRFLELLVRYGADVNHNHGEALQSAASQGRADLLGILLEEKPSVEALTLAFPRIFDANVSEDELHELITLFTDHKDGQHQVDVMFVYPGSAPIVFRALSEFPRSTKILQALLDVGFYHEQMTTYRVMPEVEEDEPVTLLLWALLQSQKKISSAVINLLIEKGAKVDFETRVSRVTPLMVAIQNRRQDLVKSLLLAGAQVDVQDATGRSPLSMAAAIGGELGVVMMSNLLAAGASRNDGSLHNAARELNLQAMQVLVEYNHDPDFPSPLHEGRSALGELCLHAAGVGEITAMREKQMEKAINFLIQSGSDISLQSNGKSVLLLALESADPLATTKVLLRTHMWKFVNKPFNLYTDGKFTYSPTVYVERVLPASDHKPELQALLRHNRCADVYYANSGPQPDGAKGLPVHLEAEEQERRARLARLRDEDEDHARALRRARELAAARQKMLADQAELEEAARRRALASELSAVEQRRRADEDAFNAALRQQRARQAAELSHREAIARADDVGHRRLLEHERELGSERVGNAAQLSSLRLREREEAERFDRAADARFRQRVAEQRRLVESQNALAASLSSASGGPGLNRRQVGFISGELGPD
ncbi:hypothetical protein DL766_009698 [Monosporascus sp. MC13-8B]|uniref:Uncharacterized protein n=1 Tax=Monosporascus cannonballus TaxID=155416 RepID=A0ABY0HE30_9PEZI|nr:hypothetical protein DL763_011172 [Monosporascus cannonballus]RYO91011.1 hypothetical protein DL762_002442 [Monosporascus cannonballus]RYP14389.1 hypothetical protein DL766_009698 [Monosporascus sp. MC13-8B]